MNPTVHQQTKLDEMTDWTDSIRPFYILSGSAGTGKTFITRRFLEDYNGPILMTATTHKAVGVLSAAAGVEGRTIHSALGLTPLKPQLCKPGKTLKQDERRMRKNMRGYRIVVVDEGSQLSTEMIDYIKRDCAENNRKYLIIADHCQIPPINEPMSPVFDLTDSSPLTEIIRQAEGSPIITLATQIRGLIDGETNVKLTMNADSEMGSVKTLRTDEFLEAVHANHFMEDDNNDRVISWTNEAVKYYNSMICSSYGITEDFVPDLHVVFNEALIKDDQIIAYNGQEGNVTTVEHMTSKDGLPYYRIGITTAEGLFKVIPNAYRGQWDNYFQQLKAAAIKRPAKWQDYYNTLEEYADIRPRFASSCHKAQGSTYENVYIDLIDMQKCRDDMTRFRLIYTAITRATNNVYIRVK